MTILLWSHVPPQRSLHFKGRLSCLCTVRIPCPHDKSVLSFNSDCDLGKSDLRALDGRAYRTATFSLEHRWGTSGLWARSGPLLLFIWPAASLHAAGRTLVPWRPCTGWSLECRLHGVPLQPLGQGLSGNLCALPSPPAQAPQLPLAGYCSQ